MTVELILTVDPQEGALLEEVIPVQPVIFFVILMSRNVMHRSDRAIVMRCDAVIAPLIVKKPKSVLPRYKVEFVCHEKLQIPEMVICSQFLVLERRIILPLTLS